MKKIIFITIAGFLFVKVPQVSAQTPLDIAYQTLPTSVAIDIPEDITQVASNLQSSFQKVNQLYIQTKADATNLQMAAQAQFNNITSGAILGSLGMPQQNDSSFCGTPLKSIDESKIAKKMKQTMLTYPSLKWEDQNRVNAMRASFYIDNVLAIHASAVKLQNDLKKETEEKILWLRQCINENEKNACDMLSDGIKIPEGDNNNASWAIYAIALQTMDNLVKDWEQVAALKARLRAIKSMYTLKPEAAVETSKTTEPAAESKETSEQKTSLLLLPDKVLASAEIKQSSTLSFAQLSLNNQKASLAVAESQISGSKKETAQLVTQGISFVMPDEAENTHPVAASEDKLEELSKMYPVEDLANEAMSVHNMLKELKSYKETADTYAEIVKEYEKSLQKLRKSDQCAIKYLSTYFSNPVKVWSGVNLGEKANAHNLRKGISGWAWEAYETAKSAETSIITVDDFAQISLDEKTKEDLQDDPDFKKNEKAGQKSGATLSASKKEKMNDESRKAELKPWQIGAEASKILASDPSKWGSPVNKKMVWTDTKNFYRQYLQRKYDNIKSYLKVYTRDDVLALVVAKLKGKKQDINDTKYQKKRQETENSASQKMLSNLTQTIAAQQKFDAKTQSGVSALQGQRQSLLSKMDKLSTSINAASDEIADMRSVAEDKAFADLDEQLNAPVVYPSSVSVKMNGSETISTAIGKNKKSMIDEQKISSLEKQQKTDNQKLEKYQKELDKLDVKIAETKLAAQENGSGALNQAAEKLQSIQQSLTESIKLDGENYASDVRKNLLSILGASAALNPTLNPAVMLAAAEEAAELALNNVYEQVDKIIDGGYQQMLALGDELYTAEAQSKIVEIHNRMITQIKGIMLAYSVVGLVKVQDIAVYAKLELADISPEEEGFFVGATAKARDLKAPYAIPDFDLPPVREVFHFDAHDFAVIKPYVKGKKAGRSLSASEFLNYGGEIPAIWQEMLKDNAFIESRFNLKEALDYGCTQEAFARGGIMPCVVSGSSVVLDVNKDGEYIKRTDISSGSLPECLLVTTKKGGPYHSFWDGPVKFASTGSGLLSKVNQIIEKPADPHCEYSELGMLLEADDNNNLKFKELAFNTYNNMLADTEGKKLKDEQKNKIAAAYHASLMRNQIGDFLKQAENEKTQRENMEEFKQKYEAQMENLKKRLQSYGFAPAASFDLRKDSDYKLAQNKLKAIRNSKMSEAKNKIATIAQNDNKPIQERVEIVNKLISTMKSDDDGVLKISIVTPDNNNIKADLKKAKADTAIVDKYKKSLKEQAKDYNEIEEPYCANY